MTRDIPTLFNDFWGDAPLYNASYFKRFFKLPIGLFNEIVANAVAHDNYFAQKRDASGKLGLTPLQKICSAVRQLTSGVSPADHDDNIEHAFGILQARFHILTSGCRLLE